MAEREKGMNDLHELLEQVPPEYHEQVARDLEHTVNIILRTLEMVRKAG
ncbi:MAG: hypothetical protein MSS60_00270 [Clostridiales bacterium]|nr:hypothetical protein [Clostridiales bacterium]